MWFVQLCNMRTPRLMLLAAGSLLVGCTIGDTVGDDDVNPGATCGNGAVDSGEQCDDGGAASGDGCSATCQTEPGGGSPALTSAIDKATVSSELGQTVKLSLTLTSVGGFAGDVQVAPTITFDGAPLAGLTVAGPTTVTVAANATVPAQYEIVIPINYTGKDIPAAEIKFDLTGPVEVQDRTSALSLAAVYTVGIAAGTGTDVAKHTKSAPITVKPGTKIRYKNNDTITHRTHGDGPFLHEPDGGGAAGLTYTVDTTGVPPGSSGALGCHNHGDATYTTFTVQ